MLSSNNEQVELRQHIIGTPIREDSASHKLMDVGRKWDAMLIENGIVLHRSSDNLFLSEHEQAVLIGD